MQCKHLPYLNTSYSLQTGQRSSALVAHSSAFLQSNGHVTENVVSVPQDLPENFIQTLEAILPCKDYKISAVE